MGGKGLKRSATTCGGDGKAPCGIDGEDVPSIVNNLAMREQKAMER